MKKEDIISKVRFFLHDENKDLWSDEELIRMTDEAARQYSADTEMFCGSFYVAPDEYGNFNYPENYIHFLCGWNSEGGRIQPCSVHDIWDFDRAGEIEYIYDDATSQGSYSIYPEKEIRTVYDIASDDYGVFSSDYGVMKYPLDYGLTYSIVGCEFAGDIIYCRAADAEEIQDYTALVYKVLELAHTTESEFADPRMASVFRNSYNSRIARFKHNKHKTAGYHSAGIFY